MDEVDEVDDMVTRPTIVAITIAAGIALILVAQLLPWAALTIDNLKFGPGQIDGEMVMNEYQVSYDLSVGVRDDGGLVGGIGGSFGGVNESGTRVFLAGMGDFQERIGPIFDSYKDKEYGMTLSSVTTAEMNAELTVGTHVDTIPWWVVGMDQSGEVWVTLDATNGSIGKIVIERVTIEQWTDYDRDAAKYANSKTVWEQDSPRELREENDTVRFPVKLSVDEHREDENIGFVAHIEATMYDRAGNRTQSYSVDPFGASHPSTVNVRTMSQGQAANVALAAAAFPLTLAAVAFSALALVILLLIHTGESTGERTKKRRVLVRKLLLTSFVISTAALVCYILGILTLVDLISFSDAVREGFQWKSGTLFAGAGVAILGVATGFFYQA